MKIRRYVLPLAATLVLAPAFAALHDRGGGLVYDDVLNVTWLQDANYAKTLRYTPAGLLQGDEAIDWAKYLQYYDPVRKLNLTDWRLPTVDPVNGKYLVLSRSDDGSSDIGYNITSPASELGYMFHVNLKLRSKLYPDGSCCQPDFGAPANGIVTVDGVTIFNLASQTYWTGTAWPAGEKASWIFHTSNGYQNALGHDSLGIAWAVRDGDVAAIPELPISAQLLLGLFALVRLLRRNDA